MKLGKTISKFDQFLGKVFFRSMLPLSYNIINKRLNKKIKKNINSKSFIQFSKKGYFVIKKNFSGIADDINEQISKEKITNKEINIKSLHYYSINTELKKIIKNFININLKEVISDLSSIYKMPIYIANVTLRKTNHFNSDEEKYNNYFHNDIYLGNHLKVFFNLHDMNIKNGPTVIIPSDETKKILNYKNRFKKRGFIVKNEQEKKFFTNNLKKGALIVCNTCECLHRASVPEKYETRDILTLTLIAYPTKNQNSKDIFNFEKEYEQEIWNGNSNLAKKLAKPGLSNLLHFYKIFN